MKAVLTNDPYYPRTYNADDIAFCDYLNKQCRLSKYVSCMCVTYLKKIVAAVGEYAVLHTDNPDKLLSENFQKFNKFSTATRTKYRKSVRLYRAFRGVSE